MARPDVPPAALDLVSELRRHLAWVEEEGDVLLVTRPPPRVLPRAAAAPAPMAVVRQAAPVLASPPAPVPAMRARTRSADPVLSGPEPAAPPRPQPPAPPSVQRGPGTAPPAPSATRPSEGVPARLVRRLADLPKVERFREEDRRPLDEIRRSLGACTRCKLCSGRKSVVFGVGNPRAELVFVGEGPGAEEDVQGVPFVGAAGVLLTKMIEAMGLQRDEVYICNVVKCRPPGNRVPELDEIAACEPFLRAQLAAVQPKVLVGLGKTAVQVLLRQEVSITQVRGAWREYAGVPLMPTFHPAYLLRSPAAKKDAWEDLKKVMKLMGKEPRRP